MKGAIIGDVVGSVYEFHNIKTKKFPLFNNKNYFTDDTILTCATADWLLNGQPAADVLVKWGKRYQDRSYEGGKVSAFGKGFTAWLNDKSHKPYKSHTNGCVMRLSPIPLFVKNTELALKKAVEWTQLTHNHPDSIKAVKSYVEAFHMSAKKVEPDKIKKYISKEYGYDLFRPLDEVRKNYNKFYCSCQKSVPEAMISALDGKHYEDSIRNAISLGGDSDTLAAMAGGLAEARFGAPDNIFNSARTFLDNNILKVVDEFYGKLNKKG